MRKSRAFTLVELLVVIGIIALLISILLPALSSARKQANTVKCATQLREIGNAFALYATENRQWYPPAQIQPAAALPYEVGGIKAPTNAPGLYWFNFINKYVTRNTAGVNTNGAATAAQIAEAQQVKDRSVLWGCAAWTPYKATLADTRNGWDFNRVQTGYGMNGYPGYRSDFPAANISIDDDPTQPNYLPEKISVAFGGTWNAAHPSYGFTKVALWAKHSSEKLLVSDATLWLVKSDAPPLSGIVPAHQGDANAGYPPNGTFVSIFRHGAIKRTNGFGLAPVSGGGNKVIYNVLYADGHVVSENDPKLAYKTVRMKFPG